MSDHRKALSDIMNLCATGRTYTRRMQAINNIAMKALGLTAGQRHEAHLAIMDRVGDEPIKDAYLKRRAKFDAKMAAYAESKGLQPLPVLEGK
jgi:hypothetical protein